MSIYNSIKRLFGFGEDDFEEEIGIDATVTPRHSLAVENGSQPEAEHESEESAGEDEPVMPEEIPVNTDEIFEHVLKVFNESLPPFLKESVDAGAQRKYLYDTLNESVKAHLEKVRSGIAERMEISRRVEMTQLRKQLHEAGEKAKRNEETSGEWKRQQLSAERQKRAMAERIHDLENKINEMHAEREQFELENKSLVNRLRVYSVQDEDMNALRDQIVSLQEQLEEARKTPSTSEEAPQLPEGSVVLTQEEFELMKTKRDMADSMINDLNTTAAELRQQLASEQEQSTRISEQLSSEQEHNARLAEQLELVQQELSAANENLSMMDTIREQLEQLDVIMEKKNSRIKELQDQNETLKRRNDSLSEELMSLKKTIESNLLSQARSESEMQKVIDGLKDELARNSGRGQVDEIPSSDQLDMPVIASERGRKKQRKPQPQNAPGVRISAIDDSLESTDWLVATPPPGTPALPGISSDSDFGYKETNHKNPPENDAQMSLW